MTSYPGQPTAPSRTLIWLAVASFVIGIVLSAFFVWRAVANVPEAPEPIDNGPVQVDSDGFTIFSSIPVLRPPCEAKDESGNDVPLEEPTTDTSITLNDDTWYVVANSVDRVPGTFAVSCLDDETGATYAVGPRLSLGAFVGSIIAAIGSFLLFFAVGVVLIIVNTVKTRRAKRAGAYPGNTFPAGPGYPAGPTFPGYPPSGPGYPQQNYPPQNYPQQSYPPPGATYPPQNPPPPSYPNSGFPPPGSVDPRWPTSPQDAKSPDSVEPPPGGVDPRWPTGPADAAAAKSPDSVEPPPGGVDPRWPTPPDQAAPPKDS